MLQPGQTVDRYTVESVLGTGGTAVVYLVTHQHLGTRHALKVLSVTSGAIRERMLREGRWQARLQHLNIVAVTDVLEVQGNPGLLMEYIDGPSLESALSRYTIALHAGEILFQGMVAGVRHAHEHDLVHRDLKPANVLLDPTDEGYVPKVTDFGLAKVLQADPLAKGHTRGGIAMGTPAYMAPEQIRDAANVDQRADIFSLGCILYELCTGHRAFEGEDAIDIYNAVLGGTYVDPRELNPELPDRFVNAIAGAMLLDRDERIPDCETLMGVLVGEDLWDSDVPPPTEEMPRRRARRILDDSRAPELAVAARGPGGATPGPPPDRTEAPASAGGGGALGLAQATTAEVDEEDESAPDRSSPRLPATYGTLGGDVSLDPQQRSGGRGFAFLLGGLVGFVVIVAAVLLVTGTLAAMFMEGPSTPSAAPLETQQRDEEPAGGTEDEGESKEADADRGTEEQTPEEEGEADEEEAVVSPVQDNPPQPQPTSPKPRKPRPVAKVPVTLVSIPFGAELRVDGQSAGRTPGKVELTPGSHAVTVESGGEEARFSVDVPRSGEPKWCYSFKEARAYEGGCP